LDGTRDRPPGKAAENWSRKDGIRAGAVSGPWRSAPRDPGAAVGRRGPEPPRHAPLPQALPTATDTGPQAGMRPGMRAWIAFGALAAVAIVAAAFLLRMTQSDEAPMQRTAVPAPAAAPAAKVAAPAPTGMAAPAPPRDPALAGVTTVRLRIGPDFPAERKAAILAALADAGITGVLVETLPFEIATSRVGYYRTADLAAAEALGRVVTPVIAAGGEVGVRDYGPLLADAEPGRLDLWVGG
jgi:hypothetical protein